MVVNSETVRTGLEDPAGAGGYREERE